MVSFAPRPLYPEGKRTQYPANRGMGGPESTYSSSERRKFLFPARNRIVTRLFGLSARRVVTV